MTREGEHTMRRSTLEGNIGNLREMGRAAMCRGGERGKNAVALRPEPELPEPTLAPQNLCSAWCGA
jgi:hypothetical protein